MRKKYSRSSKKWLKEHFNDIYVIQAKKKGIRSRSWFKIKEIQRSCNLFKPGMNVVELGAFPGGWSQFIITQIGITDKLIACDILSMNPIIGVDFIHGDLREKSVLKKLINCIDNRKIQVVISDMAPNICGIPSIDMPKSMSLVRLALEITMHIVSPGGDFVVKIFHGDGFDQFLKEIKLLFTKVKIIKPNSSRSCSREVYVIAIDRKL